MARRSTSWPCTLDAVRGEVDVELAELDRRDGPGRDPAPQVGADAGEQLREVERLGQVVVGAGIEAQHDVDLLGPGGEHDHGRLGVPFAQPAADLDAVHVGQAQVEQHEVRLAPRATGSSAAAPVEARVTR